MMTKEKALSIGAAMYEISYADAKSRWRTPRAARARWYAWHMLRREGWTLTEIGRAFEMDHTTIIHGLRRLEEEKNDCNVSNNLRCFDTGR